LLAFIGIKALGFHGLLPIRLMSSK